MIKNNILFHNVDEIEETKIGYRLHRFKKTVSENVNTYAREMNCYACGCEMRFVTEAPKIKITLYSDDIYGEVLVYRGDNLHSHHRISKVGFISFDLSVNNNFNLMGDVFFADSRFSKDVWRIYFHSFRCTLVEVDTFQYAIRPPKKSEMPQKTLLSYGSSISHAASIMVHSNAFAQTCARLAGYDCLIKGTGGSCHTEKSIADDFAARNDWDVALLELGINMLSDFSAEEFKKRFDYFIDKITETKKKFILLTIFPCVHSYHETDCSENMRAFNKIIRDKYNTLDKTQCLLIEGSDIITSGTYLSCDCVHPSNEGQLMMGINLYNKAKGFLHHDKNPSV